MKTIRLLILLLSFSFFLSSCIEIDLVDAVVALIPDSSGEYCDKINPNSSYDSIIWSAFIFGIAHFNPWQIIGASLAGILIGWAYVKTNSLIPGIMIHFVNNLISFSIMTFSQNNSLYLSDFIDTPFMYSILIIISLIILTIGGILINKKAVNTMYN